VKFKKPSVGPAPISPGGGIGRSRGTPQWMLDWIANKGKWCLLSCGCKDAWDDRSMTILYRFGAKSTEIWCDRCQRFVLWVKWIEFTEYKDIAPAVIPDEPPF